MKKFAPLFALLAFLVFAAPSAQAQLTIFNLTPCPVQVVGGYNYTPNPCTGQQCTTNVFTVPAGGSTVIPGGTNCFSPSFPPPAANFFGFKMFISSLSGTSVDICSNPINTVNDCLGNPRTVQIFNFNFGAIF